jgi:serine/threonine protein kinase
VAAASLQEQIAGLHKQLAHHQFQLAKENRRKKGLEEAGKLLLEEGLDENGEQLSEKALGVLRENLEKEQGVSKAGSKKLGMQVLESTPALAPVSKEELAAILAAAIAVDSSDSENEWDDVDKGESEDDEGEDEGDEGDEEEGDEGDEEHDGEWEDSFPFEENLFRLGNQYTMIKRLATNDDAVVYSAVDQQTGVVVAIKISMGDDDTVFQPKAINLVSAAQGHVNMIRMTSWHNLPQTKCYCMVTELVDNDLIIDCVFGHPERCKQYLLDTLLAVQHCHNQGVLFRDVKPDNIMWSHAKQRAVLIDFDVATFNREERGHRAIVGSDGYMAPEITRISRAKEAWKKKKIAERKQAQAAKVQQDQKTKEQMRKSKFKGKGGQAKRPQPTEEEVENNTTEEDEGDSDEEAERKRPSMAELGCTPYGRPVDVFSCGVVLGQLIFQVEDEFVLDYPDHNKDTLHDHFMRLVDSAEEFRVEHDLMARMTDKDPVQRITLEDALLHPYFTGDAEAGKTILDAAAARRALRNVGGLQCFGCNKTLHKDQFTKNQIKKKGTKVASRRCSGCTGDE